MYLQLGQNTPVDDRDIIGIFDLDNTTQSKVTRKFLNGAEQRGEVVNLSDDIPKSFTVCSSNGKNTVYLCQPNPATMLRRSESGNIFEPL